MSSSTSANQREPTACDATAIRHFAIVGQLDLLIELVGGRAHVPRQVLDPNDDFAGPFDMLSELGRSERHFERRAPRDPQAATAHSNLRAVRARVDIEIVELEYHELGLYAELRSRDLARTHRLAAELGPGEAAVLALVESRGWSAVVDEAAARRVLASRVPDATVWTCREILRLAALDEDNELDSAGASDLYDELLAIGYRGPNSLWS